MNRRLFFCIFFIVLFFLTPHQVNAASPYVNGKVVVQGTNAPVAGVWVKWTETWGDVWYVKTDSNGNFTYDSFTEWTDAERNAEAAIRIDSNLDGVLDANKLFWTWPGHFSCGDNPHDITVVKPVTLSGSFSTVNNLDVNNTNKAQTIPNIVFTPSGPPPPTSTPTPPPPTPTIALPSNIINLNFGISNSYPWIQAVCGDIRNENGVKNPLPAGQSTIATNASCTNPGIIFTGNSAATFGSPPVANSNQIVGGALYPEVYSSPGSGGIFSSYNYLSQKAQSGGLTPINLATRCTISNCTLPANLPHGIYQATGNVNLNAYTFPLNQDYVFLINGTLTIRGNIITPVTSTSFFSASGNIIIPPTVGNPAAVTTANLSGIFSTDRSFLLQSNNNCSDLRLNLEGTLIINAARSGGVLQNDRDLCAGNLIAPTLELTQRLDFVLNLPDFVRSQRITIEEATP